MTPSSRGVLCTLFLCALGLLPLAGAAAAAPAATAGAAPPPAVPAAPKEAPYLLTPPAGPAPRLNGPKVYGCRPGHPFLYRLPTTGERPIAFSAVDLPAGLVLDAAQGIVTGTAPARGEYRVTFTARNAHGASTRVLRIQSGDTLALTPPMGWNHWYAHYNRITDAMMREAADLLVSTGMADVGYAYVSIDDCWMRAAPDAKRQPDARRIGPFRDAQGNILPNDHFPDMAALTAYIHARGLKAGTYTSPGPLTCAGFAGAHEHEEQDARQFAAWGFDLLKYDWCSYGRLFPKPHSLETMQKPYRLMGDLLRRQPRDIVFNLCQYGMGDVWKWGAEVGGHSWRTAGDLGFALDKLFAVARKNIGYRAWQRPGAWNDPDYIQIGYIGAARGGGLPAPCPLTPTEQYSFMSLWCLMASPLFYSGDMTKLDAFTLNVLCNPELIDLNQDPLGECAAIVAEQGEAFILVKNLEDGSKAVGLCNGGAVPVALTARWSDLGLTGPQLARDPWRQRDLGPIDQAYTATVPRHGVVVVRLTPASAARR